MRRRLALLFSLIALISYGQSQEKKDSLVSEMCKAIINTLGQPDSVRIYMAYNAHLYPFLAAYPKAQRNDIGTNIYFRLQRNCKEFKEILDKADPPQGDWETVTEKPKTALTKNVCRELPKYKNYTYLESTGDTVRLTIDKGYWIDNFKDGTFSKLKFSWVNDCEFEIEFVESNNQIRKNFSKPGDKYRYQVVGKKRNYYDMSVNILGTERHLLFKLYF